MIRVRPGLGLEHFVIEGVSSGYSWAFRLFLAEQACLVRVESAAVVVNGRGIGIVVRIHASKQAMAMMFAGVS